MRLKTIPGAGHASMPGVNPYAANPGDVVKHLVLAELLHAERRRITAYVDSHSGRPWNMLTRPEYTFIDPQRQPRAAWADTFMELATGEKLGRDIKNAHYTKILQEDHGAGAFWGSSGLSSSPVYPGSVGIALASATNIASWFCGERDSGDQRRLRAALPPRSVFGSVLSGLARARVEASLGPSCLVLVDPFDLDDAESEDARSARAFVIHAARRGAIVEAWYPLVTRKTPANIAEAWKSVGHGLKLEVWWSQGGGPPLKGAGIIVANVGARFARRITGLLRALESVYGTTEIDEHVQSYAAPCA